MKIFNKTENKANWPQLIAVFILGILIACNGFLLWNSIGLQKEIVKLKSDDLAIAQAVNAILSQIQPAKILPTSQK
jgi:hypothetical protein